MPKIINKSSHTVRVNYHGREVGLIESGRTLEVKNTNPGFLDFFTGKFKGEVEVQFLSKKSSASILASVHCTHKEEYVGVDITITNTKIITGETGLGTPWSFDNMDGPIFVPIYKEIETPVSIPPEESGFNPNSDVKEPFYYPKEPDYFDIKRERQKTRQIENELYCLKDLKDRIKNTITDIPEPERSTVWSDFLNKRLPLKPSLEYLENMSNDGEKILSEIQKIRSRHLELVEANSLQQMTNQLHFIISQEIKPDSIYSSRFQALFTNAEDALEEIHEYQSKMKLRTGDSHRDDDTFDSDFEIDIPNIVDIKNSVNEIVKDLDNLNYGMKFENEIQESIKRIHNILEEPIATTWVSSETFRNQRERLKESSQYALQYPPHWTNKKLLDYSKSVLKEWDSLPEKFESAKKVDEKERDEIRKELSNFREWLDTSILSKTLPDCLPSLRNIYKFHTNAGQLLQLQFEKDFRPTDEIRDALFHLFPIGKKLALEIEKEMDNELKIIETECNRLRKYLSSLDTRKQLFMFSSQTLMNIKSYCSEGNKLLDSSEDTIWIKKYQIQGFLERRFTLENQIDEAIKNQAIQVRKTLSELKMKLESDLFREKFPETLAIKDILMLHEKFLKEAHEILKLENAADAQLTIIVWNKIKSSLQTYEELQGKINIALLNFREELDNVKKKLAWLAQSHKSLTILASIELPEKDRIQIETYLKLTSQILKLSAEDVLLNKNNEKNHIDDLLKTGYALTEEFTPIIKIEEARRSCRKRYNDLLEIELKDHRDGHILKARLPANSILSQDRDKCLEEIHRVLEFKNSSNEKENNVRSQKLHQVLRQCEELSAKIRMTIKDSEEQKQIRRIEVINANMQKLTRFLTDYESKIQSLSKLPNKEIASECETICEAIKKCQADFFHHSTSEFQMPELQMKVQTIIERISLFKQKLAHSPKYASISLLMLKLNLIQKAENYVSTWFFPKILGITTNFFEEITFGSEASTKNQLESDNKLISSHLPRGDTESELSNSVPSTPIIEEKKSVCSRTDLFKIRPPPKSELRTSAQNYRPIGINESDALTQSNGLNNPIINVTPVIYRKSK